MNKYISKYSKYDTHFNRVDQWKDVPWQDDEPEVPRWLKALATVGFFGVFLLPMVI